MRSDKKQARLDNLKMRLERIDSHLAFLVQLEKRYPWLRLAVFVLGLSASIAVFSMVGFSALLRWSVLGLFIVLFIIVAKLHQHVLDSVNRFKILRRLTVEQSGRASLDWAQIPLPAVVPVQKNHPFALDLDLIAAPGSPETQGTHTLHRLLDVSASTEGSQRLVDWLQEQHPDMERIKARQGLVQSLLPRTGFRDRLHLSGALVVQELEKQWDGKRLLAWMNSRHLTRGYVPLLAILFVLAISNVVLFVLFNLGQLPAYWLGGVALFWALQGLKYRETSEVFSEATFLARGLGHFRAVLVELERYPYPPGDPLTNLCRPFWDTASRPSASLRSLSWIVSGASFRSNPLLGLILNTILPWDMFFTLQLEYARRRLREYLPRWLETWYELEALLSLANFSVLNPDYVFPELQTGAGEPIFHAQSLGHPLLPDETRTANDFELQHTGQIVIITGSNMSGKSTFLRTVGVNLVLAYAGGPVCAESLSSRVFRLYTSINISDSLSDGISYFYAEVRRLKSLLDALRRPDDLPLFFLIDEIFRGTNNRERQIGSLAYTRALAGGNGAGLISTHDLELVHLADEVTGIRNMHFREDVRDGRMVFDFRLRPGPSPTTNALKIMALEGLPVTPEG